MSITVPPSWKDLNKSLNDLLSKDYPLGTQLEVKTKTPLEFFPQHNLTYY